MPNDIRIEVRCSRIDCYWNIGIEYASNCSKKELSLSDNGCLSYISKEDAEERLNRLVV